MRMQEDPPRRGVLKNANGRSPERRHKHAVNRLGNGNANTLLLGSSNNRAGRTGNGGTSAFRAKEGKRGTSSWQLKQFAEATLGSGSLRKAVQLPEGEDLGEWLAVNGISAYNPWIFQPERGANWFVTHSCRFLQPDQPYLRLDNGVLLAAELP